MKSKIEKLPNSQKLLRIEIEKEKIASEMEEIYLDIQKEAKVDGFRHGRAPKELVRQRYKKEAGDETLKRLISQSYVEALKFHNVSPLGMPEISDVNFKENESLTYIAKIDVRPEVKIKNYKGLNLTKKDGRVKPSDIDEQIRQLQERFAEFFAIEDRGIIKGDYILCDLECLNEGKIIEKQQDTWLLAEEDSSNQDYLKQLMGKKPKETVFIETKLPENFPNKELAGKKSSYKIFIKDIKQKKLPELTDEFAKCCGNFKTLDELRTFVEQNLKNRNDYLSRIDLERQIDRLLLANSNLETPANLVELRFKELVRDAKEELKRRQMPQEKIDEQSLPSRQAGKNLEDKLKVQAENQVKLIFILEKIAEVENIAVSQKEIDQAFELAAKRKNVPAEELSKDKNLEEEVSLNLRDAKVMEFLIKEAKINEAK